MREVLLSDSWVLEVTAAATSVCFVLDAALLEGHPRFYWPPRPGEQYPYTQLRWCLYGRVHWIDGPHLDHPAVDANGEQDFGSIDTWLEDGGRHRLEGDWGSVVVHATSQSVEYLDGSTR